MIPPHLPGNRNPPQIDRQGLGKRTSHSVLFPLHPLKKKVKHWLCSPNPHPTHSSVCGTPLCKG